MHSVRTVLAGAMALGIAGCAVHPQPEDVLRPDATLEIVQRIRCEAHDAVLKINQADPKKFDDSKFSIAFRFTLTAAEKNDNALSDTAFKDAISKGTVAIGLGGMHTRHRTTERKFVFVDTFAALRDLTFCSGTNAPERWDYPITGSIGLQEVMTTYAALYRPPPRSTKTAKFNTAKCESSSGKGDDGSSNSTCCCCCKEPEKPKLPPALPTDFHDTLKFTAQYYGSVKPTIVLTPMTRSFHFASGTDKLSADRTDIHQVDVAVAPSASAASTTLTTDLLIERRLLSASDLIQ